LEVALTEAREKKFNLESESEALTQELTNIRMGFDSLQAEVTDLQVRAATKAQEFEGLERQLQIVQKSVNEVNDQLSRMTEESTRNADSLTENQYKFEESKVTLERDIREAQEAKSQLSQQRNDYEILAAQVRANEDRLNQVSRARNELQSKMNEAQLKLEQARMKAQYLVDQMRERYMLELPDVAVRYHDREGDMAQTEVELKELREKISKIGDVNLSAIEEYEDTAKRYEFLSQQQTDLVEAKEQLRKVIDRINRICSKRFKETFDLVNERFTRVFPVLFGGGEARLELHEDPDKGEMGIEIIAKPPGKKMQSVTLMSGGEKALTAVALVFSIFLVKPSPYCLLDEVDAPLDDANVYRFNDLVREMSRRSQIIVVTHNKHTMEVVGRLYGVTMQERGVSTMVSVNLQDKTGRSIQEQLA
ncbi:MAG: chromosome segregation protein SMC, partial [Pseudobdellovibrionaceae bacterium]